MHSRVFCFSDNKTRVSGGILIFGRVYEVYNIEIGIFLNVYCVRMFFCNFVNVKKSCNFISRSVCEGGKRV